MAKSANKDNFERFESGLRTQTSPAAVGKEPRRRQKPHDEVLSWFGNDEQAGRPVDWLDVAI